MQVDEPGLSVDVMRVSGGRGDAGIDRLAALPHHDQPIGASRSERAEKFLPRGRERAAGAPEGVRDRRPWRRLRAISGITGINRVELANALIGYHLIPAFGARCIVP
jgi:hypothetical protein